MAYKVTNLSIVKVGGNSNTYRASWSMPSTKITKVYSASQGAAKKAHSMTASAATDHYVIGWEYDVLDTAGRVKRIQPAGTSTERQIATFNAPSEAIQVYIVVNPMSKNYTYWTGTQTTTGSGKNKKTTTKYSSSEASWYTGTMTSAGISTGVGTPNVPTISKVDRDGRKLTVTIQSDDVYVTKYYLEAYLNGSLVKTYTSSTLEKTATFVINNCVYGGKYQFQAYIVNERGNKSAKCSKTEAVQIIPSTPLDIPEVSAVRDGVALVNCRYEDPASATEYIIEYVSAETEKEARSKCDSGQATSITSVSPICYIYDLEANTKYWFRFKVKNDSGESEDWSALSSAFIFGTKPDPPTVWNSKSVYMRSELATLNWVHNPTDGAEQSAYRVYWKSDSGESGYVDGRSTASSVTLSLVTIPDGSTVSWNVRTLGVEIAEMSDPSETISFRVWDEPSLTVSVPERVTRFPLKITVDPNTVKQKPIAVDIEIRAVNPHIVMTPGGDERYVQAGGILYSSHNNTSDDPFILNIPAGEIFLADGQEYEVYAACVMNSGLSCSNSSFFTYDVSELDFSLGANILENDGYSVNITPYAIEPNNVDSDDENVESGIYDIRFIKDVVLSIFRFETDGTYTPLVRNMPNDGTYSYVDYHAALGVQNYRIIAYNTVTGYATYEDVASNFLDEGWIIISWDDEVTKIRNGLLDEDYNPTGDTEMLILPYNIEITEDHQPDMAGINYIGRDHPVGAYGTQLGETAQWSTDIDREDTESIAKIRELSRVMRDVYVREPMGSGYYAMVAPSMRAQHGSHIVTVNLNVTRTATIDKCVVL